MKRILAIMLAAAMTLGLASCGSGSGKSDASGTGASTTTESSKPADSGKALVVAVPASFEEKWNPFMAENAYDMEVMKQMYVSPQRVNSENIMTDWAGHIDTKENADGTVTYTVTVNKDMKFSDGKPVTIDSYIYFMYVISDPSYTGPMALITEDIKGLKEYYYDDENYTAKQAEIDKKVAAYEPTAEEVKAKAEEQAKLNEMEVTDFMPDGDYYADYTYAPLQALYKAKLLGENVATGGGKVKEISGIKRVDDYTATVTYNTVNIYGDRAISGYLVPEHYYGELVKGDVSKILSNMEPVGSGCYIWGGFADNIVTLTANDDYFEGQPVTKSVKYQYVPESDTITALASGEVDIANPTGSVANIEELKKQNITYVLTDNAGYGYMGMNAKNHSQNVRKGIFSLMNRAPSVEGYYGEIASVIERPMTTVLAEYPKDAKPYYEYSREKALEFFKADGYVADANGKLMKDGKPLVVNVYIGGDGEKNHPAYAMFAQAAEDMKAIGAELQIQDVQFNVLQGAMNDGTADIWCMAWGAVNSCDKTTQFRSDGGQNRYHIADAKMDALLDKIKVTVDLTERTALVSEMLDLSMDLAIELPLYQRKNILAYSEINLDVASIPQNTTAFWNYSDQLWKVATK